MDDGWPRRHDGLHRERPAVETRRDQSMRLAQERGWARENDTAARLLEYWAKATHAERARFMAAVGPVPRCLTRPGN